MDLDDLDIYNDLDTFQQEEEKKSAELLSLESKYNDSLKTNEALQAENADLKKQIKRIGINFQNLLDTAKAEIRRKDKQIDQLRKEKDDICFRRRQPHHGDAEIASVNDGIKKGTIEFPPQHYKAEYKRKEENGAVQEHVRSENNEHVSSSNYHTAEARGQVRMREVYQKYARRGERLDRKQESDLSRDQDRRYHTKGDHHESTRHRARSRERQNSHRNSTREYSRGHDVRATERLRREGRDGKQKQSNSKEKEMESHSSKSDDNGRRLHSNGKWSDRPRHDREYKSRLNNTENSRGRKKAIEDANKKMHSTDHRACDKVNNLERNQNTDLVKSSVNSKTLKDIHEVPVKDVAARKENAKDVELVPTKIIENDGSSKKSKDIEASTKKATLCMNMPSSKAEKSIAQNPLTKEKLLALEKEAHKTPAVGMTTPKKAALFDRLFGRTPNNTESVNSALLSNVIGLIKSSSSISTSPSNYTDTSEQIAPAPKTKLQNSNFDECFIPIKRDESKPSLGGDSVASISDNSELNDVYIPGLGTTPVKIDLAVEQETEKKPANKEDDFIEIENVAQTNDTTNVNKVIPDKVVFQGLTAVQPNVNGHIQILENVRLPNIYEVRAQQRRLREEAAKKVSSMETTIVKQSTPGSTPKSTTTGIEEKRASTNEAAVSFKNTAIHVGGADFQHQDANFAKNTNFSETQLLEKIFTGKSVGAICDKVREDMRDSKINYVNCMEEKNVQANLEQLEPESEMLTETSSNDSTIKSAPRTLEQKDSICDTPADILSITNKSDGVICDRVMEDMRDSTMNNVNCMEEKNVQEKYVDQIISSENSVLSEVKPLDTSKTKGSSEHLKPKSEKVTEKSSNDTSIKAAPSELEQKDSICVTPADILQITNKTEGVICDKVREDMGDSKMNDVNCMEEKNVQENSADKTKSFPNVVPSEVKLLDINKIKASLEHLEPESGNEKLSNDTSIIEQNDSICNTLADNLPIANKADSQGTNKIESDEVEEQPDCHSTSKKCTISNKTNDSEQGETRRQSKGEIQVIKAKDTILEFDDLHLDSAAVQENSAIFENNTRSSEIGVVKEKKAGKVEAKKSAVQTKCTKPTENLKEVGKTDESAIELSKSSNCKRASLSQCEGLVYANISEVTSGIEANSMAPAEAAIELDNASDSFFAKGSLQKSLNEGTSIEQRKRNEHKIVNEKEITNPEQESLHEQKRGHKEKAIHEQNVSHEQKYVYEQEILNELKVVEEQTVLHDQKMFHEQQTVQEPKALHEQKKDQEEKAVHEHNVSHGQKDAHQQEILNEQEAVREQNVHDHKDLPAQKKVQEHNIWHKQNQIDRQEILLEQKVVPKQNINEEQKDLNIKKLGDTGIDDMQKTTEEQRSKVIEDENYTNSITEGANSNTIRTENGVSSITQLTIEENVSKLTTTIDHSGEISNDNTNLGLVAELVANEKPLAEINKTDVGAEETAVMDGSNSQNEIKLTNTENITDESEDKELEDAVSYLLKSMNEEENRCIGKTKAEVSPQCEKPTIKAEHKPVGVELKKNKSFEAIDTTSGEVSKTKIKELSKSVKLPAEHCALIDSVKRAEIMWKFKIPKIGAKRKRENSEEANSVNGLTAVNGEVSKNSATDCAQFGDKVEKRTKRSKNSKKEESHAIRQTLILTEEETKIVEINAIVERELIDTRLLNGRTPEEAQALSAEKAKSERIIKEIDNWARRKVGDSSEIIESVIMLDTAPAQETTTKVDNVELLHSREKVEVKHIVDECKLVASSKKVRKKTEEINANRSNAAEGESGKLLANKTAGSTEELESESSHLPNKRFKYGETADKTLTKQKTDEYKPAMNLKEKSLCLKEVETCDGENKSQETENEQTSCSEEKPAKSNQMSDGKDLRAVSTKVKQHRKCQLTEKPHSSQTKNGSTNTGNDPSLAGGEKNVPVQNQLKIEISSERERKVNEKVIAGQIKQTKKSEKEVENCNKTGQTAQPESSSKVLLSKKEVDVTTPTEVRSRDKQTLNAKCSSKEKLTEDYKSQKERSRSSVVGKKRATEEHKNTLSKAAVGIESLEKRAKLELCVQKKENAHKTPESSKQKEVPCHSSKSLSVINDSVASHSKIVESNTSQRAENTLAKIPKRRRSYASTDDEPEVMPKSRNRKRCKMRIEDSDDEVEEEARSSELSTTAQPAQMPCEFSASDLPQNSDILEILQNDKANESNGILPAPQTPTSLPANISQDEQYRELDSRLEQMFASPKVTDKTSATAAEVRPITKLATNIAAITQVSQPLTAQSAEEPTHEILVSELATPVAEAPSTSNATPAVDFNASDTFLSDISSNSLQVSNMNVTIDETDYSASQNMNSSVNDSNASTKHISLGTSDYRFEKVSDNVVNLFITRKRRGKRKQTTATTATTITTDTIPTT
ncbi:PREDICTED: centrosomal protein of 290 kDa isoform X2 [Rhagoletis zephyria]|uniref:centrosomal protein of 290 kDa isoform X2 n=1 Tax=Rhagoletis zephyria TaxID=28612 RepID=UPI0008117728|nr:PREDICTED: centrosomal protein of 290 kDa isoform X2 [Rhagoletis zephyria]